MLVKFKNRTLFNGVSLWKEKIKLWQKSLKKIITYFNFLILKKGFPFISDPIQKFKDLNFLSLILYLIRKNNFLKNNIFVNI